MREAPVHPEPLSPYDLPLRSIHGAEAPHFAHADRTNMITDSVRLILFPAMMAFAACSDLLTMTISNRVALILVAGFIMLAFAVGMSWDRYPMACRRRLHRPGSSLRVFYQGVDRWRRRQARGGDRAVVRFRPSPALPPLCFPVRWRIDAGADSVPHGAAAGTDGETELDATTAPPRRRGTVWHSTRRRGTYDLSADWMDGPDRVLTADQLPSARADLMPGIIAGWRGCSWLLQAVLLRHHLLEICDIDGRLVRRQMSPRDSFRFREPSLQADHQRQILTHPWIRRAIGQPPGAASTPPAPGPSRARRKDRDLTIPKARPARSAEPCRSRVGPPRAAPSDRGPRPAPTGCASPADRACAHG